MNDETPLPSKAETPTPRNALLPCPFCGSSEAREVDLGMDDDFFAVQCWRNSRIGCGAAVGSKFSFDDARAKWNDRLTPSVVAGDSSDAAGTSPPTSAPEVIYLQYHGDGEPDDESPVRDCDVTWCRDRIFEHDLKYVRPPPASSSQGRWTVELDKDNSNLWYVVCEGEPVIWLGFNTQEHALATAAAHNATLAPSDNKKDEGIKEP